MATSPTEANAPADAVNKENPPAETKGEYLTTPIPPELNKKVKALALDDDEDRENGVDDEGRIIEKSEEDEGGFNDGNEVLEIQSLCMRCHEDVFPPGVLR